MKPNPSALLHALEAHLGGRPFAAGQQLTTELAAPDWQSPTDRGAADGLRIKVTITVERRAPAGDVARYRAELLAELAAGERIGQSFERRYDGTPARARCEIYTKSRGAWPRGGGRQCEAPPAALVAYETGMGRPARRLVCNRHRDAHGVDAARVLAIVELVPSALEKAFREGCEARRHKREQAIADARAAGRPVCKRCGVDGSCCVPPCDYEQRPAAPGSA